MTPIKQTVYLPVEEGTSDMSVTYWEECTHVAEVKEVEGYFFTPEQLNEYTAKVIKDNMEYKLISRQTDEEYLCDKITIDGFDYYVIDKTVKKEDGWCWDDKYKKLVNPEQNLKTPTHDADFYWKIIATNNPNIDIPQVGEFEII